MVYMEFDPGFPLLIHSERTNTCVNRLLEAAIPNKLLHHIPSRPKTNSVPISSSHSLLPVFVHPLISSFLYTSNYCFVGC